MKKGHRHLLLKNLLLVGVSAGLIQPGSSLQAGELHLDSDLTVQGNVGIGTTTPQAALDIHGDTLFRGDLDIGSTTLTVDSNGPRINTPHGYLYIGPRNSNWSHFSTDRGRYYFNREIRVDSGAIGSYNENLSLRTQGTTRITALRTNGNVGIGITNPEEKLHINGNIRGNQGGGALRVNTLYGYLDMGPKNSSWSHFVTDRGRYYFNREIRVDSGAIGSYNENLSLRTHGTTRITVLRANGNVGIGTTSPQSKLDVNGEAYISGATTVDGDLTVQGAVYLSPQGDIPMISP